MGKPFILKTTSKLKQLPKWWWLAGAVAIVLLIAILELTSVTHLFHAKKAVSSTITTASPSTPSPTPSSDQTNNDSGSSGPTPPPPATPDTSGPKNSAPSSTTGELIAPYGTFVSNHFPGKDGAPTTEDSVCITTPGASCTITFTNGDGVIKTLAAGTADNNGAVYWKNWDVKQAGFTNGSWVITATATLNGQSKSAKDSLNLEVAL